MRTVFKNEKVLQNCKIFRMLEEQSKGKHLSFHTPGHKQKGFDITELSYSDNLSCPRGCIAEAEKDIAEILGAEKSFILTDGSTSGVLSMLYAAKKLGVTKIALCEGSHKSVFNGCAALGITPLVYSQKIEQKMPFPHTMYELNEQFAPLLDEADALFFTSPDYYGNIVDWAEIRKYCDEKGKLLIVDGAHGGHLHFEKDLHAGQYADMWVDGVHKSLPALTQGAVVSARTKKCVEALAKGVDIFRTTSPSYPIMASVEYAVKYPRNAKLEEEVKRFAQGNARIYKNKDWTKLVALFGENAFTVEKRLQAEGIYPEFCDGNAITFYLSPATEQAEFAELCERLTALFVEFPIAEGLAEEKKRVHKCETLPLPEKAETEWVPLEEAEGRICAGICGLFPPCVPLFSVGERIEKEKIRLLQSADNVFGVKNGEILVLKIENEE